MKMSHIRVLISQVDDEEAMKEVAAFDVPVLESEGCEAAYGECDPTGADAGTVGVA